jgi:hypothetical protein
MPRFRGFGASDFRPANAIEARAADPVMLRDGASASDRYIAPMGKLVRRLIDGDETVVSWTPDDPDSVEAAKAVLREEMDAGYHAVRVDGDAINSQVTELPPDADVIILTMPMGGGAGGPTDADLE